MNIEILDVNNEKKMSAFLKVKNEAFKARSSERMPFVYRTEKDLKEKLSIGESFVAIANVDNQVVGGMGCRYLIEDGLKVAELFWIATSDKYQRRGVAKNLFYYVEDKAYSNNIHLYIFWTIHQNRISFVIYGRIACRRQRIVTSVAGGS